MISDPGQPFEESHSPQTIVALYDRYYQRVYAYLRYRCDEEQTAEDLTAQVFEQLLRSLDRLTERQMPVEAWVIAVARNLVSDHFRRQRFRSWLPWEALQLRAAEEGQPEEEVVEREWHSHLSKALQGLSDRERDLVGLKFSTGFNNREIADLTGISESNVGVILYRALHKMRKALHDLDPLQAESFPGSVEVSHEQE